MNKPTNKPMNNPAIEPPPPQFIAFEGSRCLILGPLREVALAVSAAVQARPLARFMVFDAQNSELVDFDHRGSPDEVLQRLAALPWAKACLAAGVEGQDTHDAKSESTNPAAPASPSTSGPGRPKLGVVAREVTLLPRHWAWLAAQPGGASVALRKLVDQARKSSESQDQRRLSQEASYRFMSAMAGSLDGFEEAARALFAGDRAGLAAWVAPWPQDIQSHLMHLAQAALQALAPADSATPLETPHA